MPSRKLTYKHTIFACYAGYMVQALIVNYVPLLYVTFESEFGASLQTLTLLTTVCFGVQILTDFVASKLVDKIGYRVSVIAAHVFCTLGLCSLSFLPNLIHPTAGLIVSACLYAMGGGLIGNNMADRIVDAFLNTPFEGGRHQRRVDKIEG